MSLAPWVSLQMRKASPFASNETKFYIAIYLSLNCISCNMNRSSLSPFFVVYDRCEDEYYWLVLFGQKIGIRKRSSRYKNNLNLLI